MSQSIDLNCDMGESFGAWRMGNDEAVLPWVTSGNIACGFHAGDPATMLRTTRAAVAAGVAVGAHIGLPDKAGFGRRVMAIDANELHALTLVQIGALQAMARACGGAVGHVKPHGALYHMLEDDPALAEAFIDACRAAGGLRVFGLAGGRLLAQAERAGLPLAHEALIDRAYTADGRLLPRGQPGALIESSDNALAQAIRLARGEPITTSDVQAIRIRADTLCIHGDRADAAAFARAIHQGLHSAGILLQAFSHHGRTENQAS